MIPKLILMFTLDDVTVPRRTGLFWAGKRSACIFFWFQGNGPSSRKNAAVK